MISRRWGFSFRLLSSAELSMKFGDTYINIANIDSARHFCGCVWGCLGRMGWAGLSSSSVWRGLRNCRCAPQEVLRETNQSLGTFLRVAPSRAHLGLQLPTAQPPPDSCEPQSDLT